MKTAPRDDWYEVLLRLMDGDRLALVRLSRLLNGFLTRWNAYDFRDEWDDLIQEVLIAAVQAVRQGQFRDAAAAVGWLRSTTRFKWMDRLRSHMRCRAGESLPWEEEIERIGGSEESYASPEVCEDMKRALERLPETKRAAVLAVYLYGKTYDEVAEESGVPLGSLKRHLREALTQLRAELRDSPLAG